MSSPIRVSMIIQNYLPNVGGAERQLDSLAPLLRKRQVEINVITRQHAGMKKFEVINGVPVHRISVMKSKAGTSLRYSAGALPIIAKLKPHVLHAHGLLSPTTTAVLAKKIFGVPVVSKSLRGGLAGDLERLERKPLGKFRITQFSKSVDAFITISTEIRDELVLAGIPDFKCNFIPNGVDISRFQSVSQNTKLLIREQLNLSPGPVVVSSSRLEPEKRIDQLITIWPQVLAKNPDAQLLILGTGSLENALKKKAGAGIRFEGLVDDVLPYLQTADLFVLPSATEGLSNALLEAMATGLPALLTEVGGALDLIEHKNSGWLIPPDHPGDLLAGVVSILEDHDLRKTIRQNAARIVREKYSLVAVAERLANLYAELVEGK